MKCDDCRHIDVNDMFVICREAEMYFDNGYQLEVFARYCNAFSLKEKEENDT